MKGIEEQEYEDYGDRLFRLHRTGKTELLGKIFLDQENSGVVMDFSGTDKLLHPSDDFISKLKHAMNGSDDPGIQVLQARLQMVEASRRLQEAKEEKEAEERVEENIRQKSRQQ